MTSALLTSALPRVLLVEDDPVSRAFLSAAIHALPAAVDAADSMAAALALAAAHRYDAWLFDANLPDGSGAELLERLRMRDSATPALAHTAAPDAQIGETLRAAGFAQVLVKPLPALALQKALRQALGPDAAVVSPPVVAGPDAFTHWDDEAATRALNGNSEHVTALRKLFLAELPAIVERVRNAFRNEDYQGLHGELHRLRASCGFVGAARLQEAVHALGVDDRSHQALQDFTVAAHTLTEQGAPLPSDD
jgi:CheY-like chemotaxis protein/HPt (histidine-containing phosphotransfer) domain-containing protein